MRLVSDPSFRALCCSREFLAENFSAPVRLEDAAREAFLSPYHFHRMFSRAFGETPHEFLTRVRMEAARQMLLQRDLSVSDVCLEAGYQSLGSFSSAFRLREGMSPTEFRRVFGMPGLWALKSVPACFRAGL